MSMIFVTSADQICKAEALHLLLYSQASGLWHFQHEIQYFICQLTKWARQAASQVFNWE